MPRKPAYAAKRGQDGETPAASERADATRASANGRRRGVGDPSPTKRQATRRAACAADKGLAKTPGCRRPAYISKST